MLNCSCKIHSLFNKLRNIADNIGFSGLQLVIRLFMANIFFQSGRMKFENYLNDDWGSTVYLFEDIHPVPFVPAEMAACAGTAGELGLSVLLAFGLLGRFAAAGLLVMTLVIQFAVPADYGMSNPDHYMWMMLLAVIVAKGAGMISLDKIMCRFCCKKSSD